MKRKFENSYTGSLIPAPTQSASKRPKLLDQNWKRFSETTLADTKVTNYYILPKEHLKEQEWIYYRKYVTLQPNLGFFAQRGSMFKRAPKRYKCYIEHKDNGFIALPSAFGRYVFGPPEKDESTVSPLDEKIQFGGKLQTSGPNINVNQQPCADAIQAAAKDPQFRGGTFVLPTGAGKGVLIPYAISVFRQRSLYVVPNRMLLLQATQDVAKLLPGAKVEFLNTTEMYKTKRDRLLVADVVVISLHSLAGCNYPDEFFEQFGSVHFDEMHLVPSATLRKAFDRVGRIRIKCGWTATAERPDDMQEMFPLYLGPVVYCDLTPTAVSSFIEVHAIPFSGGRQVIATKPNPDRPNGEMIDALGTVRALVQDDARNDAIVDILCRCIDAGRKTICFTEFNDHALILLEKVKAKKAQAKLIHAHQGTPKEERETIFNEAQDVLFATPKLIGFGVNILWCDTLVLAIPISGLIKVNQFSGRLRYPKECDVCKKLKFRNGHMLLIFDIVDEFAEIDMFQKWYRKRTVVYKGKGYKEVIKSKHRTSMPDIWSTGSSSSNSNSAPQDPVNTKVPNGAYCCCSRSI